jgi:amino acid transporter
MTRFKTPVPAILLLSCTTFALTNLNFTSLLAVDTTLNVISIVLVVISYLRLRYIQPALKRPYEIPGGIIIAWLISIPSLLLSCFAFTIIATSGEALPVTFAFVLVIVIYIIGYIREKTNACWGRWKYSSSSSERKRRLNIDIDEEEDKENKEDEMYEELLLQ